MKTRETYYTKEAAQEVAERLNNECEGRHSDRN